MLTELASPRFHNAWIRIHDSGDFFSDDYLLAWLHIIHLCPDLTFYCYTKEVDRFRRLVEVDPPNNFRWTYSYGGTQDASLDPAVDRVTDVFPDSQSIAQAGFTSQEVCDTVAATGPPRIGIPANRIPHFITRLAGRRFSEWQAEVDTARDERRSRRHLRLVADPTSIDTAVQPAADEPVDPPCAA
jgi:hypothetical protein